MLRACWPTVPKSRDSQRIVKRGGRLRCRTAKICERSPDKLKQNRAGEIFSVTQSLCRLRRGSKRSRHRSTIRRRKLSEVKGNGQGSASQMSCSCRAKSSCSFRASLGGISDSQLARTQSLNNSSNSSVARLGMYLVVSETSL